ncbi:MAG: hypothetical protein ABI635_10770 [Actinomycetota bacterium]
MQVILTVIDASGKVSTLIDTREGGIDDGGGNLLPARLLLSEA